MMKCLRKTAYTALVLAAAALVGCASAPEDETVYVELTAPTVAPVVTPLPMRSATPAPAVTPVPEKTALPQKSGDEEKPKKTEKPKGTPAPKKKKTPNADNYTHVEIKSADGKKVNAFSAASLNGSTITESYFSGGTITLVNFWSTT